MGGEIVTFPQTLPLYRYSGVKSLWCFNTVGGEILTFPDTPTLQHYSGVISMVFQHSARPAGSAHSCKGVSTNGSATTSRAPTGGARSLVGQLDYELHVNST